jgi:xanthine dehydrogenase accessory factor
VHPERIVVRGGGELASAAARLLFLSGFQVLVLERDEPLAVRRLVAFAEAVFTGEISVEGVVGRRVTRFDEAGPHPGFIPVMVDPDGSCLGALRPAAIVDARMAKRNLGTPRLEKILRIGLGPGFVAGTDVDAVVETQRGPDLGRVLWEGSARADTGVPAPVAGRTRERVLRAPRAGVFRARSRIGALVWRGEVLGTVDDAPVAVETDGLIRGLLRDGVSVREGSKVGDVDPRGRAVAPDRISDKARAVAAGVLEAVLCGLHRLSSSC